MSPSRLLVITAASWLIGWALAHLLHRFKQWHQRRDRP